MNEAIGSPSDTASREEQLSFTGSGTEYFRIWIVNTLLTIVTLGIYSAWAKVRKQQYFYGHTHLAGASFAYHGDPIAILKGRLIAAAMLAVYGLAVSTSPALIIPILIAYFFLVPWVIVMALRFRARVSSWRGIRFGFDGSYGQAFAVFCVLAVLVPFTFGLIIPDMWCKRFRFTLGNLRFGATEFTFSGRSGGFYRVFLRLLLIALCLGVVVLLVAFVGSFIGTMVFAAARDRERGAPVFVMIITYLAVIVAGAVMNGVARAWIGNLVFANTRVGPHAFRSRFEAGELVKLQLSNTVLIIVTLGLYLPFAQVRLQKYLVEHASIRVAGDLDSFVADQGASVSATGGEMAEMFEIDLGI